MKTPFSHTYREIRESIKIQLRDLAKSTLRITLLVVLGLVRTRKGKLFGNHEKAPFIFLFGIDKQCFNNPLNLLRE